MARFAARHRLRLRRTKLHKRSLRPAAAQAGAVGLCTQTVAGPRRWPRRASRPVHQQRG
jgi:hypothetical protein